MLEYDDSIFDTLITDRTLSDVEQLTDKGMYRASDLNRIEQAISVVAEKLNNAGHNIELETGSTWTMVSVPTYEETNRILRNLSKIRNSMGLFASTPYVPSDMDVMTYQRANDIEQIILDVNRAVINKQHAYVYAGMIYAGDIFI